VSLFTGSYWELGSKYRDGYVNGQMSHYIPGSWVRGLEDAVMGRKIVIVHLGTMVVHLVYCSTSCISLMADEHPGKHIEWACVFSCPLTSHIFDPNLP